VSDRWRPERVQQLAARLRRGATQAGIALLPSISPIQPVVLGSSVRTLAVSERLFAAGFWVAAIREPTVPKGSARLRITLCAAHREAQVDALIDALAGALRDTAHAAA
jgi:8-amino-7-oxononanoate synthase